MPKFYTSVILQSKEICEKQFSVFGSKGGQISPLMNISFSPGNLLIILYQLSKFEALSWNSFEISSFLCAKGDNLKIKKKV